MDILTAIKDVVIAGAAVYAAYRAGGGLKLWRQKLRGETDFDVARQILERLIVVRKTFWILRDPLILAHEFGNAYRDLNADDPDYWSNRRAGFGTAYGQRWNSLRNAWVELEGQSVKAEALWGPDVDALISDLRRCVNRINASITTFLDDISNRGEIFDTDRDLGRRIRADVSARFDPEGQYADNPLSAEFHDASVAFEKFCRSKLQV